MNSGTLNWTELKLDANKQIFDLVLLHVAYLHPSVIISTDEFFAWSYFICLIYNKLWTIIKMTIYTKISILS